MATEFPVTVNPNERLMPMSGSLLLGSEKSYWTSVQHTILMFHSSRLVHFHLPEAAKENHTAQYCHMFMAAVPDKVKNKVTAKLVSITDNAGVLPNGAENKHQVVLSES